MEANAEQLAEYLESWMNKAVSQGGFTLQEASQGLAALQRISALAKQAEATNDATK